MAAAQISSSEMPWEKAAEVETACIERALTGTKAAWPVHSRG